MVHTGHMGNILSPLTFIKTLDGVSRLSVVMKVR